MSDYFPVVIHHNPACGTSRQVLSMIEAAGHRAEVVRYLETGWTRPQLLALFAAAGERPRAFLRDKSVPAENRELLDPDAPDDVLIEAMIANPVLVNRPIVVTPRGVRLCRPADRVLELLAR